MGVQLKSMLNFTTLIDSWIDYSDHNDCKKGLNLIMDYANFLNQKPELWMFVPCDEEGNVLEEPMRVFDGAESDPELIYQNELDEYREAKSKVIFEGFNFEDNRLIYHEQDYRLELPVVNGEIRYEQNSSLYILSTIEEALQMYFILEVTQSKAKELGLI